MQEILYCKFYFMNITIYWTSARKEPYGVGTQHTKKTLNSHTHGFTIQLVRESARRQYKITSAICDARSSQWSPPARALALLRRCCDLHLPSAARGSPNPRGDENEKTVNEAET